MLTDPPRAPERFGRFDLLIEMGSGGMATLFLARMQGPESFEKLLAIKRIHEHLASEERFVRMFLDEARIAAGIHHPNVATIFDLGRIGRSYFIAMEYVHGENLNELLRALVQVPAKATWPLAVRLVADAAAGLHAAHELRNAEGALMQVVHRDVSPQNLLISYDGNVKVVDFGIAYAAERLDHTATGIVKGKARYMSPEQTRGEPLDRRSDVFSLGIVLWEMLCLRRLFRATNEGEAILLVREAVIPPLHLYRPDLPDDVVQIVRKALARNRDDRYATAAELSEHLERALAAHGAVISRPVVARLLEELFHERRQTKDQQIQAALRSQPVESRWGGGARSDADGSLEPPPVPAAAAGARRPVRRRLLLAGAAAAAVAVAAVAGGLLASRGGPGDRRSSPPEAAPARPAGPPPEPGARPPSPPARVRLTLDIHPPGCAAVVTFRGRQHPGTRFVQVIPHSSRPETLLVEAPGFVSTSVVVVPSEDATVPVSLKPAVEPVPERPPPDAPRPRPRRPAMAGGVLDLPE
jgi:serine/threonine-protein kinase